MGGHLLCIEPVVRGRYTRIACNAAAVIIAFVPHSPLNSCPFYPHLPFSLPPPPPLLPPPSSSCFLPPPSPSPSPSPFQQQDVTQLSAQLEHNLSLTPTQNNTQLAMLPEGSYEGVSPSNQQVGVSKPTNEALVTTAQVMHKVQSKGQSPVLSHGHAPSPTHFQMPGHYLVGMPYPNPGGVQFVATGNQYQQQNIQQHPMMSIPVSTQLPSAESPLPTATVPSPYLYQQVPASPLQQVAGNQSFFHGIPSMQQQGPPVFSPPGMFSRWSG